MKIALFGSKYQKEDQIKKIFDILTRNNVEIVMHEEFDSYLRSNFNLNYQLSGLITDDNLEADIAISIGGDGTFLRTAQQVGKRNIPILGINTGRLGFLADINDDNVDETLEEILANNYRVERRTQLQLACSKTCFKDSNYALNEIAILKQDTASMLTIHAAINGEYLTSYQADGLIIATPTGSTAYALSVGGPIMTPDTANFIIAAVAPHSLNSRPLVVDDNSIITLNVESRSDNFLVSLDGRSEILTSNTELTIYRADFHLNVVKRIGHTFYETLKEKLMWGADTRYKSE